MSARPKLLLLAYACQPNRGSEPGVGWNRALQAAKTCETWVICEGREFEQPVKEYLAQHGEIPNLRFVFLPRSAWNLRLSRLPGMYYMAYRWWHRAAYRLAKKLHQEIGFDLVHQVSLCGYREPGYTWQLPVPFIWGPLGGAQNYPWRFIPASGWNGAIQESLRNVLNSVQLKFSRRVKRAARHSAKVLAASTTNAAALARRGIQAEVMLETGAPPVFPTERNFRHGDPLRILWSGLLEHRKALHLLLTALARLPSDTPYELHILGQGPQVEGFKKLARKLNVASSCHWLGWVPQSKALAELQWADVFVFSSLRDTSGNVVLEAFAAGTPVVALDHHGAADMVTDSSGLKIAVNSPRQVAADLATTLAHLHADRTRLEQLSRGARHRAEHYSWDRQGQRMAAVYDAVLAASQPGAARVTAALSKKSDVRHLASVAAHPTLVARS